MAMATALVMAAMAMTTAAVATGVVTTFVTVMAVQMGLEAALSADQLSALTGGADSWHAVSMRKKRRPRRLDKLLATTLTKGKAPPKDMLTS